jgi:hypothetical protein
MNRNDSEFVNNQFLELSNQGKNGPARWIGGTLLLLFCWLVIGSFIGAPFLLLSGTAFTGDLASGDPFWNYLGVNFSFFGIWLGPGSRSALFTSARFGR